MADAFGDARGVEREGWLVLLPYLKAIGVRGELVTTEDSLFCQKFIGDAIARLPAEGAVAIEVKCEQRFTGNLFLETWSNRSRCTPGWLLTSRADWLWYYFLDTSQLYSIRLPALRAWAVGSGESQGGIYAYPERVQGKREQANDTWGRIVPISKLSTALIEDFRGPVDPRKPPESGPPNMRQRLFDL